MHRLIEALLQCYVGECQARNRYDFYAKTARKEGYIQISAIFEETALHEHQHGKTFYRMALEVMEKTGETMNMAQINEVAVPIMFADTPSNLREAIKGEHHENSELYPGVADIAEEEGYTAMAAQIRSIAKAEAHHEVRYKNLLKQLEEGTLFKKKEKVWWYCQKCGYWHYGEEPPEKCPACNHPKGYFKRLEEEF